MKHWFRILVSVASVCSARGGLQDGTSDWYQDVEAEEAACPRVELLQHAQHAFSRRNSTPEQVWLQSGVEARKLNETFYHVHIPKVAGLSFGLDALDLLSAHGRSLISREGCFDSPGKPDPGPRDRIVLLRNPAAHVLSMYNFCRYHKAVNMYVEAVREKTSPRLPDTFDEWLTAWTELQSHGWSGNMTPSSNLVSKHPAELMLRSYRTHEWQQPPFALQSEQKLSSEDWPLLDGGGTIWHNVHVPFSSYTPINFQSQRMTCTHPMHFPEEVDIDLAIRNMNKAFHIGIAEAYQSSLCVLHAKIANALPSYCDCTDDKQWNTFSGHSVNENLGGQNDPKKISRTADMSQEMRRKIETLTALDQKLFSAGWERLVQEARWVEATHGKKVLCDETEPPRF